jgi:opacity protein-like surface antigen
MKTFIKLLISLVVLLLSTIMYSQNKWSVELRPNIDFPTKNIRHTELKTGFGFEVAISYNFMAHLAAYVGWGYNTFKTTSNLVDFDNDVDQTGYTFGFQLIHPIKEGSDFSYLIRAGGIYNHLEFEDRDGNVFEDTGHGLGFEVGAGLDYTFSETWHIRPQIGYRTLSRDVDFGAGPIGVDFKYIAVGIGIAKTF